MKIQLRDRFVTSGPREREVEEVSCDPSFHDGFLRWFQKHGDGTFTYYTERMWREAPETKWVPAKVVVSDDGSSVTMGVSPIGNGLLIDLPKHLRARVRPDLGANIVEFQQKVPS